MPLLKQTVVVPAAVDIPVAYFVLFPETPIEKVAAVGIFVVTLALTSIIKLFAGSCMVEYPSAVAGIVVNSVRYLIPIFCELFPLLKTNSPR